MKVTTMINHRSINFSTEVMLIYFETNCGIFFEGEKKGIEDNIYI